MDIKAALTKKIGPLPAAAWGGILLLIVGVIIYWKKTHAANGSDSTETSGEDASDAGSDSDLSSDYAGDGSQGGIGAGSNTGGSTTAPGSQAPTTNQQWQSDATSYLIGFGYTATQVEQALNNWLLGNQATPQDNALFNLAVGQFGQPPEGVPPQPTNSNPTPPGLPGSPTQPPGTPKPPAPAPKPVTHTYYTIAHGDTLTAIAKKYKISEASLYSQNKSVIDSTAKSHGKAGGGHWIFPGTKLLIK